MRARIAEKVARTAARRGYGVHRQSTWGRALAIVARRERPTPPPLNIIGQYMIVKGQPVPVTDTLKWARALERNRCVAVTDVGDRRVSTVFLGLDHAFGPSPPVLWETLVFTRPRLTTLFGRPVVMPGTDDAWGGRYASRVAALRDHARIVAEVAKAEMVGALEKQLRRLRGPRLGRAPMKGASA